MEQARSIPKFSGQARLGYASTLIKKDETTTRKEEYVTTSEFSGQEVLGSTLSIDEVTVTLELLSQ